MFINRIYEVEKLLPCSINLVFNKMTATLAHNSREKYYEPNIDVECFDISEKATVADRDSFKAFINDLIESDDPA